MGIINRYAKGLLTVLDSQTQGDTPSSMGDVIAPTMEISEYLLASKRSVIQSEVIIFTAIGQQLFSPCPPGEIWFVRNVGLQAINRDALVSQWRMAINLVTPTFQIPLANTGAVVSLQGLGSAIWCSADYARPLVLQSGDGFAATCGQATGAVLGTNVEVTWIFDRLAA